MSHLWQGFTSFFGRLSVTSCLLFLLFLCSSVTSRVSLPTHFLWILHSYSHCRGTQKLIGLPDTVQLSVIPVQHLLGYFYVNVLTWQESISLVRAAPSLPPTAHPLLRRRFGLISSHYRGAVTIFLLGWGATWGGTAIGRGAATGSRSVRQGERKGQWGVRWCCQGVPISFQGAQSSRRRKREC